ncbi:MAG: DUF3048 domain-containing protein [Bacilli bacterium]|nr:DUF3048 domain-containing protein [Bacilli bacterium]
MKSKKSKLRVRYSAILGIIVFLLIGVIFVGIAKPFYKEEKKDVPPVQQEEEKKEDDIKTEPVKPEVQIVDVKSNTRPYAVMINNIGAARPYHTGLQKAYMVYEIIVEGGITRYMALFKDTYPEVLGSVRSARPYYIDYAMENDAYYIHWGGSSQALKEIKELSINDVDGLNTGKPYFFRQKLPVSLEHTGFVNLKEMSKLVSGKSWRKTAEQSLLLNYSATNIDLEKHENKVAAQKIDLKYSGSYVTNYVYDEASNVYKQSVNNKEHKDYVTNEQYTVKNIITYQVENHTIGNYGRQALTNIGSGKGYYITEGYAIPITWEKKTREGQTKYRYLDGTEITVNDGNTWIHIVPTSGKISIS